jgi:hypothetical protein
MQENKPAIFQVVAALADESRKVDENQAVPESSSVEKQTSIDWQAVLTSRTLIGALVTALATFIPSLAHLDTGTLTTAVQTTLQLLGIALTIYGRVKATRAIITPKETVQ